MWIIVIGLAAAIVGFALLFNGLVRARNLVRNGFSDMDVQLQRRHDLIPSLVEAVRAYAGHERQVLDEVTSLRSRARDADHQGDTEAMAGAETELVAGLGRLIAVAEAYPDLKASDNFRQLTAELVQTEDQLSHARRFYNGAVRDLNTRVQRFPDLLVARATGFREEAFFNAGVEARSAPELARLLARTD